MVSILSYRRVCAILVLVLMALPCKLLAQQVFYGPEGERVLKVRKRALDDYRIIVTPKHVYESTYLQRNARWNPASMFYSAPAGHSIIDAHNFDDAARSVLILLDDGTVERSQVMDGDRVPAEQIGKIDPQANEQFRKFLNNGKAILSSTALYQSPDSGASWIPDTLPSVTPDMVADSAETFYALSINGLMMMPKGSTAWTPASSIHYTNPSAFFITRRNIFLLATSTNVFISEDSGGSWRSDTLGLNHNTILKLCDDAKGNVFAIAGPYGTTSGKEVYILPYGDIVWKRIDSSITAQNLDAVDLIYNSITADMASGNQYVTLSTAYGVFTSPDLGELWQIDNRGIMAETIYALVKTANGRFIASSGLGVFYREASDTTWVKTFPQNGFIKHSLVFVDKNNKVYAQGAVTNPALLTSSPRAVFTSIDNGSTWSVDTAGIYQTRLRRFFVDRNGNQHMASQGNGAQPLVVYIKRPGLPLAVESL